MNLLVTFDELVEYAKVKYSTPLDISVVDSQTAKIEYNKAPITIKIQEVTDDSITLFYDMNIVMKSIIALVIEGFKERLPEGISIDSSSQTIKVMADKIEKLQNVIKYLSLKDARFEDNALKVDLELKK